jgi:hypothetical protein
MRCEPLQNVVVAAVVLFTLFGTGCRVEASEPELHVGKFSAGDLIGWKEETIFNTKKSVYQLVKENGKSILMGKSVNAASGLLHKMTIDPKAYPLIRWSWKIDQTVKNGNERSKNGHDFAARLYVVFPRGLFTRTRAIEYVWGNVMAKGEMLRSPYSNNAMMFAVDSGNELAGKWVTHTRNYVDDYRTAFGEEPPKVGGIAIMTDSDNTGETAVGYFGDIDVLAAAKGAEPHNGEHKQKDLQVPKENQPKLHLLQPEHQLTHEPVPATVVPKEAPPKESNSKEPALNGTLVPVETPPVPKPKPAP